MVTKIVKMEVMKYTVVYFIDVFIMVKQFETKVDWNKLEMNIYLYESGFGGLKISPDVREQLKRVNPK